MRDKVMLMEFRRRTDNGTHVNFTSEWVSYEEDARVYTIHSFF